MPRQNSTLRQSRIDESESMRVSFVFVRNNLSIRRLPPWIPGARRAAQPENPRINAVAFRIAYGMRTSLGNGLHVVTEEIIQNLEKQDTFVLSRSGANIHDWRKTNTESIRRRTLNGSLNNE